MTIHNPTHPGEILKDLLLDALELNITETAQHLGVSRKTLSKILNCNASITPEMAVRLELVFGKPNAEHWLRIQSAYDLWHVRNKQDELKVTALETLASTFTKNDKSISRSKEL